MQHALADPGVLHRPVAVAGDLNLIGTESTEQTAWGIRIQEVTATHRLYGKVGLGKADTASTE